MKRLIPIYALLTAFILIGASSCLSDDTESEPYIALIKRLAINDKLDFDTAKVLISEYKKTQGKV